MCPFVETVPKAQSYAHTWPRRLSLRPSSHWVFPTTNMFTQENWEVGGQEGGNGTEKQEKGKKIKAQPKASRERRALGHILGRGLSRMSLRLCPLIRGGDRMTIRSLL